MRRSLRILLTGLVLISIAVWALSSSQTARAQEGTDDRTRTEEVTVTQYVWNLLTASGQVVCEAETNSSTPPDAQLAWELCYDSVVKALSSGTATPQGTQTPLNFNVFLANSYWRLAETRQVERTVVVELPDLIVYASPPEGTVQLPYVILSAYDPSEEFEIESIEGVIDEEPFICAGTRCAVPLPANAIETTFTFWANSSDGSQSDHVTATAQIVIVSAGYQVVITDASYLAPYADACAQAWGISGTLPTWAGMTSSPDGLKTYKTLHFLTAELINVGAVDARDCPGGGFISPGAPNACGIERAQQAVYDWQNQFDSTIWKAGLTTGIPPRLIKALIEQESQFWPGNELRYLNEYGMAQLSNWGADVALRWNNSLYQQTCDQIGINCSSGYSTMPPSLQAMLRGALMRAIDAECASCTYGFNLAAAEQSIPVLAQTLYGNCQQVDYVMLMHSSTADYETLWKFTMLSYHGGFACLNEAVAEVKEDGAAMNWGNVANRLECPSGRDYVDSLWQKLGPLQPSQARTPTPQPLVQPTFVPRFTPTPTTPPTPVTVTVQVYVDVNNNNRMDAGEGVDGVEVNIRFASGLRQTGVVQDGLAEFEFVGPRVGERVTISVPDLYREIYAMVGEDYSVNAEFRLQQPPVPTALP